MKDFFGAAIRSFIGCALIGLGSLGILFGILSILDPVGAKAADDGDPFGTPPSRLESTLVTLAYVGVALLGYAIFPIKRLNDSNDDDDDRERNSRWPNMGTDQSLMRWTSPDGKTRVYVIKREDGMYSRLREESSDEEYEHCWIPTTQGVSFYDTEETAIQTVAAEYPWINDVTVERPREADY